MKYINKYFRVLFLIIILLAFTLQPFGAIADELPDDIVDETPTEAIESALGLTALAAVLIDAQSGRVLFEHNAHQRLPMASLTKIFTTMLVLEQIEDLNSTVTAPPTFMNVGQRSMNILPGQTFTIEELLYANMLHSANDASQLLGIATSGSEAAFVDLMNQRTAELGFVNTSWRNPHGLHHDDHFSTAYELAQISRLAGQNPTFARIAAARNYTIYRADGSDITFSNSNRLLAEYRGANGLKTGFTRAAGSCLAGSAERDGLHLIAIVLNSEDTYGDIRLLLDYGFANYGMARVARIGEIAARVPVVNARENHVNLIYAQDVRVLLPIGEEHQLAPILNIPARLVTPIYSNDAAGRAYFDDGHGFVLAVDLLPAQDLESYTFWGVLQAAFQRVMQVLLV